MEYTYHIYNGSPSMVQDGTKVSIVGTAADRASWFVWWDGTLAQGTQIQVDWTSAKITLKNGDVKPGDIKFVYQVDNAQGRWTTLDVSQPGTIFTLPANVFRARVDGRLWYTDGTAEYVDLWLKIPGEQEKPDLPKAELIDLPAETEIGQLRMSFYPVPDAQRYDVQRRVNGGSWVDFALINEDGNVDRHTVTDATSFENIGDTICFRVIAHALDYNSSQSVEECTTIVDAPPVDISKPVIVDLPEESQAGAFTLFWNPVDGADFYEVYCDVGDGFEQLGATSQLFYDDYHLLEEIGETKCYRVDAVAGNSRTQSDVACTNVSQKQLTLPQVYPETAYDISGYLWDDKLFGLMDPNNPLMVIFQGALGPAPVRGKIVGREIHLYVENPQYVEVPPDQPEP